MATFETRMVHRRISYSPFDESQMQSIADVALRSVIARIKSGINTSDSPAKPLNAAYQKAKRRKGVEAIRNWLYSGRTLGSARVKVASQDHAVIGFIGGYLNRAMTVDQLVLRLNRQEPMWGFSPHDMTAVHAEVARQITLKYPIMVEVGEAA